MEREAVKVRELEDADQIDRIAAEYIAVGDRDPVIFDLEVRRAGYGLRSTAAAAKEPAPPWHFLDVMFLERGTEDPRQVADVLRDQEVVLHEALDIGKPRPVIVVTEPFRHAALMVERKPFLRPIRHEMEVAAHRPEE